MNCQGPKLAKYLQRAIKIAFLALLLIVCYIYFMKEAIAKFQKKATTVTERSISIDSGVFSTGAMGALAPVILGQYYCHLPLAPKFLDNLLLSAPVIQKA